MVGESRFFRMVYALNLAIRGNRIGPSLTRFAYWLWNSALDLFMTLRSLISGNVASFDLPGGPVIMDLSDKSVTRALYVFREYEPSETALLARILQPGMTFVDIGANSGYYTLVAANVVGAGGKVIAFEPHPGNAEILRRNVTLNGFRHVHIEEKAVCSANQAITLFLSCINAGDHRIYDGGDDDFYNAGRARQAIHVEGVKLDDYLLSKNIKPDVIKIDVQGAELEVLKGMQKTLSVTPRIILMAEYWPHGLECCEGTPMDFLLQLQSRGFKIFQAGKTGDLKILIPEEAHREVSRVGSGTLFFSRMSLGKERQNRIGGYA